MVKLLVYISEDCWSCAETQRIVAEVAPQFPDVKVMILDTATNQMPDSVFAVPTYVLNDRVIFLGNPTRAELVDKLLRACQTVNV